MENEDKKFTISGVVVCMLAMLLLIVVVYNIYILTDLFIQKEEIEKALEISSGITSNIYQFQLDLIESSIVQGMFNVILAFFSFLFVKSFFPYTDR